MLEISKSTAAVSVSSALEFEQMAPLRWSPFLACGDTEPRLRGLVDFVTAIAWQLSSRTVMKDRLKTCLKKESVSPLILNDETSSEERTRDTLFEF